MQKVRILIRFSIFTVREEFKYIIISTTLYIFLAYCFFYYYDNECVFNHLGFKNFFKGTIFILFLNSLLYSGVLYQFYLKIEEINLEKDYLLAFRELIFAPIIEELIYRSFLICFASEITDNSFNKMFISSFLFGISHLRHIYDGRPANSVYFQVGFTTIFGLYANYALYLTGSIYSSIILHFYCNLVGLPRLNYLKGYVDDKTKQSKFLKKK